MKNFEKYEDEIREYNGDNFCEDFVLPHILKKDNCAGIYCSVCAKRQLMWFLEEYEESETDWNQVEVDTLILVRNSEDKMWHKRHFAKYKNGNVYAWSDGQTSWTAYDMMVWKYAKLAEDAKEDKEPEVDWNEVKVDTPILVRDSENTEWLKKYFAKYENGHVYVWNLGRTSWTAPNNKSVSAWQYAKLAESEEPEVDWNEVKIDTPIMVRDHEDGDWFKRYFAEYKNGKIYAWDNGHTSWETSRMIEWKYAKLVEDEE